MNFTLFAAKTKNFASTIDKRKTLYSCSWNCAEILQNKNSDIVTEGKQGIVELETVIECCNEITTTVNCSNIPVSFLDISLRSRLIQKDGSLRLQYLEGSWRVFPIPIPLFAQRREEREVWLCHRNCKFDLFSIFFSWIFLDLSESAMKSRGGSVELGSRNVIHRKWAILLCIGSFCAGMFFTDRCFYFCISMFELQVSIFTCFSDFVCKSCNWVRGYGFEYYKFDGFWWEVLDCFDSDWFVFLIYLPENWTTVLRHWSQWSLQTCS